MITYSICTNNRLSKHADRRNNSEAYLFFSGSTKYPKTHISGDSDVSLDSQIKKNNFDFLNIMSEIMKENWYFSIVLNLTADKLNRSRNRDEKECKTKCYIGKTTLMQ